nr:hypothetical protein [Acholeplasmatales bacterium]
QTIEYKGENDSSYTTTVPTKPGNYTVKVSVAQSATYSKASATANFTIYKATPNVTAPTANSGLVYTSEAQALVTAGATTGGQLQYSLDGTTYNITIPTAINAGTYTVYYKVEADNNYTGIEADTLEIIISKATPTYNIPTDLSVLKNVKLVTIALPQGFTWNNPNESVGEDITNKTFKASYTPTDTNNYLVVSNIDIPVIITTTWDVADPEVEDVKAKINGVDVIDANIKLKVEVKAEMNNEESKDTSILDRDEVKEHLSSTDRVAIIYDVKLLRKTVINGVETVVEIQPSEIKEGVTIEIEMKLPQDLIGKKFRILHIHNDGTVKEVSYSENTEGTNITVLTDKLSEFAFVINESNPNKTNVGLIILLIIACILVLLIIALLLIFLLSGKWIINNGKPSKAMKIGRKDDKIKLLCMNFKIIYKSPNEIFDSKVDALNSLSSNND